MRLFLPSKPRNLGARRIKCNAKETKATGKQFSKPFHCSKTILTFLLQIIQNEWLLTIVLNVKRCFNAKRETFSSAYLLITEIHTYCSMEMVKLYQNLEKATVARCFIFTIIFVHKIIVMIDGAFEYNTCLAYVNTSTSKCCI